MARKDVSHVQNTCPIETQYKNRKSISIGRPQTLSNHIVLDKLLVSTAFHDFPPSIELLLHIRTGTVIQSSLSPKFINERASCHCLQHTYRDEFRIGSCLRNGDCVLEMSSFTAIRTTASLGETAR